MAKRRRIFWVEIDRIKREWGHSAIYREYILPRRLRQDVKVPEKLNRAYDLAVELENLYWNADYHGLDSAGQSCSCRKDTHKKRKYPALWKRLDKIEHRLRELDRTNVALPKRLKSFSAFDKSNSN